MTDVNYTRLGIRCVLKISGEEARDFLQGLVSNDLTQVNPSQAIYAALLTPQGKYLHDFFISEQGGSFYLDCEAARIDDLFKRFRMFKLRSKVELEILESKAVIALFGDYVHDALSIQPIEGNAIEWLGGILYSDPRISTVGARAILPIEALETALHDEGFIEAPFEKYDALRLSLGLPDSSRDLLVDKSILLESGFEELNGVDFNKGCYMGQELTARTKHRGLVKKRLVPVKFKDTPATAGTEITQDGKNAGELRSISGNSGLALLRLASLESSAPLLADGSELTVRKPNWVNF